MQGYGVTYKLYDIKSQVVAMEQFSCGRFVRIHIMVGTRVSYVKVQSKEQQLLEPPLVEHAHQI